tara:strand:+ start:4602 stop:5075 length:474 start_codon:yes stop_codon:yes gene_type:complete
MKYTLIFFAILVSSCGARKRVLQVNEQKISELTKTIADIKKNITANTKTTRQYNVLSLEPIDPTQASEYNGHTFKNAKVVLDSSLNTSQSSLTDQSTRKTESTSDKTTVVKDKKVNTESKRGDFWRSFTKPIAYGIGIALIVGVILWIVYKRKTTLN